MATTLIIGKESNLTGGTPVPYTFTVNPEQPRGMISAQPAQRFPTLTGAGALQAPKDWYPTITFRWPYMREGDANHTDLRAALEARLYSATGIDYYLGATDDPGDGWPFPTAWASKKYIKIRLLECHSYSRPVDNSVDEVIYNLELIAIWLDAS